MSRSYQIERKVNTGGFVLIDTVTDATSYQDTDTLTDGYIYTYRVRQSSPYISEWSNEAAVTFSLSDVDAACILETHAGASGFRSDEYSTTIPRSRDVAMMMAVGRSDGVTWEDISEYVDSVTIQLGDVSRVGTGNQGGDSVVRQASFSLLQGDNSLWPLSKTSDFNKIGDIYSPLLWPSREVRFLVAIQETGNSYTQTFGTTQSIDEPIGTGSGVEQTFDTYYSPIKPDSEIVYIDGVETSSYVIDYDVGEITTVLSGVITMSYTYYQPMYAGYLGDSISQTSDGSKIKLKSRDYAKKLQDAYIMGSQTQGTEEGELIENVIQNIMNDNLDNPPTLRVEGTPGGAVKEYNLEYTTVYEATQQVAASIGWFLGYKWHWDTQKWEYTLMEPPRNKDLSTANYYITAQDDVYKSDLDINDIDIRNDVTVEYRNPDTGKRETVNVKDQESIDEFGLRQMLIGESDSSIIDTEAEAETFANAALADLKDLSSTNQFILPLLPEIDVFNGVIFQNPIQSDNVEFYAVESVRMRLKSGKSSLSTTLTTELVCSGSVKGSHNKWLRMETRPGANERLKPEELYDRTIPQLPANLRASFDGRDAIFNWDKPKDPDYQSSRLEIIINDTIVRETYVNSNQYIYTYDNNIQDTSDNPSPSVTLKLYHLDSAGQESSVGTVLATNPEPPTPTGLSVTSTMSQLQINLNKPLITDLDYVEYQIDDTSNFDNPTTYTDTAFTQNVPVRVEGDNFVRVRFIDVFSQSGSWATTATESVMLNQDDIIGGAAFNISPSSNPSKSKAELATLWDMDTTTGVTFSGSFSITFDYPIEWFFDMVRFYVNGEADFTVEAYDFDNEIWDTVITPKTCTGNKWEVTRFDNNDMYATGRLRISFTCTSLTIYELKFWTVTLSDEILAQTMTLTDNMAIQNEDGSIIIDANKIMLRDTETGDHAYLSPEMLAFYKGGYEGIPMWYTKRVATGVADDGTYINLTTETGVPWDHKPKIITSAAELFTYDAGYSTDDQTYRTEAAEVSTDGFYVYGKLVILGNSDSPTIFGTDIYSGAAYANQNVSNTEAVYTSDSAYNNTNTIRLNVYARLSYHQGDVSPPGDYWNIYDDTLRIWINNCTWNITLTYTNEDTATTTTYKTWDGSKSSFYLGSNPGMERRFFAFNEDIVISGLPEATYSVRLEGTLSINTGASGDSDGYAGFSSDIYGAEFLGEQIINTGKVAWIAIEGGEVEDA